MLKLIGALCVIASSSLSGFSLSLRLKEQYSANKQLLEMFSLIVIYLENEYLTADEILRRLSSDKTSDKLIFLKNASDFYDAAENAEHMTVLPPRQRMRLKRYFMDFGSCDISGEVAKTRLMQKNTELEANKLGERCEKYCRLFSVMGLLAGIGISVMLL